MSSSSSSYQLHIEIADPSNDEMIRQMLELYRPFVEKSPEEQQQDQKMNKINVPTLSDDSYIPWITSFEEQLPTIDEFRKRIEACLKNGYIFIVAFLKRKKLLSSSAESPLIIVLGYSYCTSYRARAAYRITSEIAIYAYQEKTHGRFFEQIYNSAATENEKNNNSEEFTEIRNLVKQLRGVGKNLYAVLFQEMAKGGYQTAMAFVALPNPVSVVAHERLGFRKVGETRNVASKWGLSLGMVIFQLDLRKLSRKQKCFVEKRVPRCELENFVAKKVDLVTMIKGTASKL